MRNVPQIVRYSRRIITIMCVAILAVCNSASCKTIYVATNGNDKAAGTAKSPIRTVQAGLDKAAAGDTVFLKKGVFSGRVSFPRDGAQGKPIVLTGATGAIIDGGTQVTGWTRVESAGGNIYRVAYTEPRPANLTCNNEYILRVKDDFMNRDGMTILKDGWNGTLNWVKQTKPNPKWAGVTALWGTMNGYIYIGFADKKLDPGTKRITITPGESAGGAAISISGRRFVTVRGLTVRNGYYAVLVCNNSSDCIIEKNTLIGGRDTVEINSGASRIKVRKNEITLGYGHTLDPDHEYHWAIWAAFKQLSDSDRCGCYLDNAGPDVEVTGNHIFENFDGIQNVGTSVRLLVQGNLIENLGDDGLEPTGDQTDARWCDNIVKRCNIAYRHKCPTSGPMYVYNNRFYSRSGSAQSENLAIYWFGGSAATAYIYHNIIATNIGAGFGSTKQDVGLPNVWVVNNIFSCDTNVYQNASNAWTKYPHVDYNYFGGDLSNKLIGWGNHNKIVLNGQLWKLATEPNYQLISNSPAREAGIDISKPWTVDGTTHPALPGYAPGYFNGTGPDTGAIPAGNKAR